MCGPRAIALFKHNLTTNLKPVHSQKGTACFADTLWNWHRDIIQLDRWSHTSVRTLDD